MQTGNTDAIEFYQKFGFKIIDRLEDYYGPRMDVRSAYLMELAIGP